MHILHYQYKQSHIYNKCIYLITNKTDKIEYLKAKSENDCIWRRTINEKLKEPQHIRLGFSPDSFQQRKYPTALSSLQLLIIQCVLLGRGLVCRFVAAFVLRSLRLTKLN